MTPGQPLPRIARFALPPEDEPARPRKPAKGEKGKKKSPDGEKTGVLDEATPNLDTYETRRTIRLVIGLGALGVLVAIIVMISGAFRGSREETVAEEDGSAAAPPAPSHTAERAEREADLALADARAFAVKGDGELSLKRLRGIVEGYPDTSAAEKARGSLRNAEQGLPLFVDVPLVVARPVAPASIPMARPEEAVVVVPPAAPVAGEAEVAIARPPTPPEPYRDLGLPREPAQVALRPLPPGFRPRAEVGLHASGWPWEITCDKDGSALVLVPGGSFTMGRDDGPPEERPAHRVTLSTFYVDQHEITARQFAIFARETGRRAPAAETDTAASEERPVTRVRAQEAYEYLRWAGKSLPTEAQWELAARTIDGRIHPWGNGEPVWTSPRRAGQIDPVMSFPLDLSPYGAFDLAGNAREWTGDWFDPKLYRSRADQAVNDPANPTRPTTRSPEVAIRGGSARWLSSWRAGMKPDARLPDLGFRGVLAVERAANPTLPGGPAPAGSRPSGNLVPF